MMKRILFFLFFILHSSLFTLHSEVISSVFTTMPDSLLPLLTERNRHDMLDFYNNHMEAKVRNRFNDYARLDTLTDTYLRLTLSKSSTVEMKLLQTSDSVSIICLIHTLRTPACDSRVEFYNAQWQRQFWMELPVLRTDDFFTASPDSVAREMDYVQRSIDDLRLVELTASPSEPLFTLTLSVDQLAEDEKKLARRYLRSLRYRWTGDTFTLE